MFGDPTTDPAFWFTGPAVLIPIAFGVIPVSFVIDVIIAAILSVITDPSAQEFFGTSSARNAMTVPSLRMRPVRIFVAPRSTAATCRFSVILPLLYFTSLADELFLHDTLYVTQILFIDKR